MTLLWALYSIGIATLLGLSALAVEHALRSRGRPARGLWLGAMAASWAVPLIAWWFPGDAPSSPTSTAVPVGAVTGLPDAVVTQSGSLGSWMTAWLGAADPLLGWVLLGSGVLAVAILVLSLTRLARRVGRWPIREVQGQGVSVSPAFGPVVVGVRRPRIVLPSWVLTLAEAQQRLIVSHEHEHREGRDPALLTLGALLVMGAPWNPALWWQMRRFRLATELDCDRRVVAGGASPRQYGELLLDVGRRQVGDAWPLAALAEPPSFLERRLRMIARRGENDRRWKSALLAAGGLGLLVGACETPVPPLPEEPLEQEVVVPAEEGETPRVKLPFTVEAVELGPLIVVDGVITDMDLVELDALEIDRIEVVKGATAADLYGSRGANGVVSITTKQGGAKVELIRQLDATSADLEALEEELSGTLERLELVPLDGGLEEVRETEARSKFGIMRRSDRGDGGTEVPVDESAEFRVREVRFGDAVDPAPEPTQAGTVRLRDVRFGGAVDPVEVPAVEQTGGVARFGPEPDASTEPALIERVQDAPFGPVQIRAAEQPLIIVDGVITDRSLADISALDVESIEIIKGAAAAKLYGSRAANGIVQITTKRRKPPVE